MSAIRNICWVPLFVNCVFVWRNTFECISSFCGPVVRLVAIQPIDSRFKPWQLHIRYRHFLECLIFKISIHVLKRLSNNMDIDYLSILSVKGYFSVLLYCWPQMGLYITSAMNMIVTALTISERPYFLTIATVPQTMGIVLHAEVSMEMFCPLTLSLWVTLGRLFTNYLTPSSLPRQ